MAEAAGGGLWPGAAPPPCVLVTRVQPQADAWVQALHALGVPAVALPLLQVAPVADSGPVRAAAQGLAGCAAVMFVSPAAVRHWWAAQAPAHRPAPAWPAGVLAAAVGPGTVAALRAAGVPAAQIVAPPPEAPSFDSEALWPLLQARRDWAGTRVLVVRGEGGGRDWLADAWRAAGAQVQAVAAYRREAPALAPAQRQALARALATPARHCWLFSSSEALGHLPDVAPGVDWSAAQALATHARIAEAARRLGFGRVGLVAPSPNAVRAWLLGLPPPLTAA